MNLIIRLTIEFAALWLSGESGDKNNEAQLLVVVVVVDDDCNLAAAR
jgi:hypothetical protein